MELQYYGLSCFKFKTRDSSVVTDPFNSRAVGLSYPSLEADAVVLSGEGDLGKIKPSEARISKNLSVVNISGSGEYEVGGIFVTGHDHAPFYLISHQDINICYLGLLKGEISSEMFEDISDIDYLIVPVGDGKEFVDWKDLEKIISEVDPSVIIPSCFYIDGMKDHWNELKKLEDFQKEFGISAPEKESKIKLKHFVETETKQLSTIILEPRAK